MGSNGATKCTAKKINDGDSIGATEIAMATAATAAETNKKCSPSRDNSQPEHRWPVARPAILSLNSIQTLTVTVTTKHE